MIPLTLTEIATATGGTLDAVPDPDAVVTAVTADSRETGPGALFAALTGERTDGHAHAAGALAAGAVAVLAARPVGGPAVLVDDPLAALGLLARAVTDRLPDLTVVGVTGSSGKTSTKDLLAAVLSAAGPTVAPQGSFNNELGVPLTVFRAGTDTRFLVVEMGARGIGHIALLCRMAPPRIGVVLNVGAAHAGEFGSKEATAQAKGELVEALPPDGVAVLNADDALVAAMAARTAARVVTTGTGPADVRAADVVLDHAARPSFTLLTPAGRASVTLPLHGAHHVANALAAAAVGLEAGLAPAAIAAALNDAAPASRWRMEVTERPDGVTVVNDAYNANPDSTAAALRALAAMTAPGARGWAVLGEMLELGDAAASAAEHRAAGELAAGLGLIVLAVGPGARPAAEGAAARGAEALEAADVEAARDLLGTRLRPGDAVLVKASRSIGLDRLAAALLDPSDERGEVPA